MCGRFVITHPNEAIAALFDAVPGSPRFNICPTNPVAMVTADGGRRLRTMRWGLIPSWYKAPNDGPLIINARSDTVAEKPAFRAAIRQRRCILPAAGSYDWSAGPGGIRLPWYSTRRDGAPMAFGALYSHLGDIDTVAMVTVARVTVAGGPNMAGIHDREPVILKPGDWPLWLGEAGHGAALLLKPTAAGVLGAYRADVAVNSNRAHGAYLIAGISE